MPVPMREADEAELELLRASEVAKLLKLAPSKVYLMMSVGQLPVVSIGRAKRVPVAGLRRWMQRQQQGE